MAIQKDFTTVELRIWSIRAGILKELDSVQFDSNLLHFQYPV